MANSITSVQPVQKVRGFKIPKNWGSTIQKLTAPIFAAESPLELKLLEVKILPSSFSFQDKILTVPPLCEKMRELNLIGFTINGNYSREEIMSELMELFTIAIGEKPENKKNSTIEAFIKKCETLTFDRTALAPIAATSNLPAVPEQSRSDADAAINWWYGGPGGLSPIETNPNMYTRNVKSYRDMDFAEQIATTVLNNLPGDTETIGQKRAQELSAAAANSLVMASKGRLLWMARQGFFSEEDASTLIQGKYKDDIINKFSVAVWAISADYINNGYTWKQVIKAITKMVPRPFVAALHLHFSEGKYEKMGMSLADCWDFAVHHSRNPKTKLEKIIGTAQKLYEEYNTQENADIGGVSLRRCWFFARRYLEPGPRLEETIKTARDLYKKYNTQENADIGGVSLGRCWFFAANYRNNPQAALEKAINKVRHLRNKYRARGASPDKCWKIVNSYPNFSLSGLKRKIRIAISAKSAQRNPFHRINRKPRICSEIPPGRKIDFNANLFPFKTLEDLPEELKGQLIALEIERQKITTEEIPSEIVQKNCRQLLAEIRLNGNPLSNAHINKLLRYEHPKEKILFILNVITWNNGMFDISNAIALFGKKSNEAFKRAVELLRDYKDKNGSILFTPSQAVKIASKNTSLIFVQKILGEKTKFTVSQAKALSLVSNPERALRIALEAMAVVGKNGKPILNVPDAIQLATSKNPEEALKMALEIIELKMSNGKSRFGPYGAVRIATAGNPEFALKKAIEIQDSSNFPSLQVVQLATSKNPDEAFILAKQILEQKNSSGALLFTIPTAVEIAVSRNSRALLEKILLFMQQGMTYSKAFSKAKEIVSYPEPQGENHE